MNRDIVHRLTLVRFDCLGRHFGVITGDLYGIRRVAGLEFTSPPNPCGEELVTLWGHGTTDDLYDVVGARAGLSGRELREAGPRLGRPRSLCLRRGGRS
jgi:hypothetical protein